MMKLNFGQEVLVLPASVLSCCDDIDAAYLRVLLWLASDLTLAQKPKQLAKLVEVISIQHCVASETVVREMALIKVGADEAHRAGVIQTANIFRARSVDVGVESVVIEVTGSEDKVASLIRLLEPYGIKELVRTGLTAMGRGAQVLE